MLGIVLSIPVYQYTRAMMGRSFVHLWCDVRVVCCSREGHGITSVSPRYQPGWPSYAESESVLTKHLDGPDPGRLVGTLEQSRGENVE